MTSILSCGDESASVGFEEVSPDQWSKRVYRPDIQNKWDILTKTPGYGAGPKKKKEL